MEAPLHEVVDLVPEKLLVGRDGGVEVLSPPDHFVVLAQRSSEQRAHHGSWSQRGNEQSGRVAMETHKTAAKVCGRGGRLHSSSRARRVGAGDVVNCHSFHVRQSSGCSFCGSTPASRFALTGRALLCRKN